MADKWGEEADENVPESWEDEEETSKKTAIKDNWDDEDEVKDSWDQEEDENKSEPATAKTSTKTAASTAKPKQPVKELTEEEKKEAQLNADLNHTNELFGLTGSLDQVSIKTKEDYTDYINRFFAKVNVHNESPLYVDFLEDLFKTMCKDLSVDAMRKISNTMRTIYDNKVAEEKLKSKDGKAKKGKSKIKIEFDRVRGDFDSFLKDTHKAGYDEGADGDDFM